MTVLELCTTYGHELAHAKTVGENYKHITHWFFLCLVNIPTLVFEQTLHKMFLSFCSF